MDYSDLEKIEEILLKHIVDMGIVKENAQMKKKQTIMDNILICFFRVKMKLNQIEELIEEVKNDLVLNLDFFNNGGNLFENYINSKYKDLAKIMFRQRSVGLGTPNSASGEGELMFLFFSKNIKKPTRGDLIVNNENIELKGGTVRVMGEIRGKDFRLQTLNVCKIYNLKPNIANQTNIEACELEKISHLNHWKNELSKLNIEKQKKFILDWLKCINNNISNDVVEKIFVNGSFVQKELIKEIIKILYSYMIDNENFDKFIILGDGTNVRIFSNDKIKFNKMVDNNEINIYSDYFRINQLFPIGWYID